MKTIKTITIVLLLLSIGLCTSPSFAKAEMNTGIENNNLMSIHKTLCRSWEYVIIGICIILTLFLPEGVLMWIWLGTTIATGCGVVVDRINLLTDGIDFHFVMSINSSAFAFIFSCGVLGNHKVHKGDFHSLFERLGTALGGLFPVAFAQVGIFVSETWALPEFFSNTSVCAIVFCILSLAVFPLYKQWAFLIPTFIVSISGAITEFMSVISVHMSQTVEEAISQLRLISFLPSILCLVIIIISIIIVRKASSRSSAHIITI